MNSWLPTFPLLNRPTSPPRDAAWPDYEGWSIPELLAGQRFAQSMPAASPEPVESIRANAEAALATSQPDWLTNAQRQVTPQDQPWPAPPPTLPYSPPVGDDPFERAAFRLRRPTSRQSPMGPPFLNEAPPNYPSHLGPIPQGPDWPAVVPYGPTPWSLVAQPPRATDWGKPLTGIECRRTEDGDHINCITPGGQRYENIPAKDFPAYFGPGVTDYHSYGVLAPEGRRPAASGLMRDPTPGPFWSVAPATPEGTRNSAIPPYGQIGHGLVNLIPGMASQTGSPEWPVTSYRVVDQLGRPAVINVTNPDHPGYRGVVIRNEDRLPSGNHRLRTEGGGVSRLQSPEPPGYLPNSLRPLESFFHRRFARARDGYTDYLWRDQSQGVIDRVRRNPRYGRPLE